MSEEYHLYSKIRKNRLNKLKDNIHLNRSSSPGVVVEVLGNCVLFDSQHGQAEFNK